jgi:hypothetical protein
MSKYSGADWIETSLKIKNMSPLGKLVADVLGQVFRGIYHLPTTSLKNTDWSDKYMIEFNCHKSLSTVDGWELSWLIVLCFDNHLRLEISPNMRSLSLMFHPRDPNDTEDSCRGIGSIEEIIMNTREELALQNNTIISTYEEE